MLDMGSCMIVAAVADRMQAEAASTPTPLQAIARAIKALSYTDMNTLGDEVEHQMRAVGLEFVHAILAAADKLEAGE